MTAYLFPATSEQEGKKKLLAPILIALQDYQAQMPTVKIDPGADFILYIFSDLNL